MNNKEKPSFLKGKGAAVSVVICFVAVIGLVGAYTFNNYRKNIEEQTARAEEQTEQLTEENTEETTADDILLPEAEDPSDTDDDASGLLSDDSDETAQGQASDDGSSADGQDSGAENPGDAAMSGADTLDVWFSEDSVLAWPASGAVIMGYSMDQTVFFQTLEQYQYNPAMIIAGEVGEMIGASAAGIVTKIDETAQTGTTVTLDMGNGYSAVYGQLTDVPVSVGDYVNTGDMLGNLNEPTKYYSVEGPNLYFEVLKDGDPVDPMNFME